jgi:ABC-type transport system involved in Fe-S cluster assembly fused permease/ATPase subunit
MFNLLMLLMLFVMQCCFMMQDALNLNVAGRSSVVVAHRLSTMFSVMWVVC